MADDLSATVARLQAELAELQPLRDQHTADQAEIEELRQALAAADAREAATADVLRVIASSPADGQRVLDTIVEAAQRLCDADVAYIQQRMGDRLRTVAYSTRSQPDPALAAYAARIKAGRTGLPLTDEAVSSAALLRRTTIDVPDSRETADAFPVTFANGDRFGHGSLAATPLLHGDEAIGVLNILNHGEPRPFTAKQRRLLEMFATQAVIAIENARLFEELEERTAQL